MKILTAMNKYSVSLLTVLAMLATTVLAETKTADSKTVQVAKLETISPEEVKRVEDKLKKTFTQLTVEEFGPSPIPGIFQLTTNHRVIYYHPEKELLIFGAIFSKDGRNLTEEHMSLLQGAKIKELPLDKALVLGDGDKEIIEFTDPDCPYCLELHKYYMTGIGKNVKRYVFFTPIRNRHPNAPAKAIHILCSDNKEAAFHEVYTQQLPFNEMKNCNEGVQMLSEHEAISRQFGVNGTPTIVLENSVLPGLDKARIAQFVNQQ